MPFHRQFITLWAALALLLSLSGCGNGSGSAVAVSGNQAPTDLSGIAATGKPFLGTVYLSDAASPPRTAEAPANPDGSFSFPAATLIGFTPPYLLKVVSVSGKDDPSAAALYSIATGPGTANINPITTAAVAAASGAADLAGLFQLFASHDAFDPVTHATTGARLSLVAAGFPHALSDVVSSLNQLLAPFGAAQDDPLGGFYAVNGQGLDGFLDQTTFTISGGNLTVNAASQGPNLFTGSLQDVVHGSVQTGILTPPDGTLPGNAVLTLAVRGQLPSQSSIHYASLTLQLPPGFTVVEDSQATLAGASVPNTALPIEGALQSNIYPAPLLSAANNQLSLNVTTLGGFGTGNFLQIRCVASSALLLTTRAADFSILTATIYSDIYKNKRIKGLSVIPVSLVFPSHEGKGLFAARCASCHSLDPADTSATGLYGKAAEVAATLATTHHQVTLSGTAPSYLFEYLTAVTYGWQVY
ncbi:hypothetical protein [Geomesophilobacter sediminis]|uniref:Cytochrome c domain-containing protein n=1 Tax=Geomesophilobacter sediminis TaxID=2798584 RepID=A0A8J7M0B4_9BACT|nr:hypothetical protein [Geomesophilobacter sediminis]MBJ6724302.1 hypothetical protein [Geomesophilobacter sediminis]